jgi:hypothetical protein
MFALRLDLADKPLLTNRHLLRCIGLLMALRRPSVPPLGSPLTEVLRTRNACDDYVSPLTGLLPFSGAP